MSKKDDFKEATKDAESEAPAPVMVGGVKALCEELDPYLPVFLQSDSEEPIKAMVSYTKLRDEETGEVVGVIFNF